MSKEILDLGTRRPYLKEGQRYTFRVVGVPEKMDMGKFTKRVWILQPVEHDDIEPIKYHVVPWEAEGIVLATGGSKNAEGKIEWDDETVDSKVFIATVNYVERDADNPKNINPKTGKPYKNLVLSQFEEELDF